MVNVKAKLGAENTTVRSAAATDSDSFVFDMDVSLSVCGDPSASDGGQCPLDPGRGLEAGLKRF